MVEKRLQINNCKWVSGLKAWFGSHWSPPIFPEAAAAERTHKGTGVVRISDYMAKWAVDRVTFLDFLCNWKAELVGDLVPQCWIWAT